MPKAHSDAVTSLAFTSSGLHLISGGHDGAIKVWDVRTQKIIQELKNTHQRKYDESIMCLAACDNAPMLVSGGADSVIKIFEIYS